MKIVVTGANGYLGKGVVKKLLDHGNEVIANDIKKDYIDRRAKYIDGDIFSLDDPYYYFESPDVLLHMAWRDGFVHNSKRHMDDLPHHYHFLSKMIKDGINHIAVMGSMHEIGFYEGSINEDTPCNPQSLYGISKNALRRAIELECKDTGITLQWLRGFYIVGNDENGCSIFSKLVQASYRKQKDFPFTLGLNQFDFIDYDLFCKLVADTVEQQVVNGIINICSGRPEKLADRVERFIKENRLDIKLNYGLFPDRPYDSKAIWGDDMKIRMIEKARVTC